MEITSNDQRWDNKEKQIWLDLLLLYKNSNNHKEEKDHFDFIINRIKQIEEIMKLIIRFRHFNLNLFHLYSIHPAFPIVYTFL